MIAFFVGLLFTPSVAVPAVPSDFTHYDAVILHYDQGVTVVSPDSEIVTPRGPPASVWTAPARASASFSRVGVAANGAEDAVTITTRYSRPSGATTRAQREAVQGRPCVECGNIAERQVADHVDPLVKEYYRTGTIDMQRMRSLEAVQPQCPTCSARQGAPLSGSTNLTGHAGLSR
ncbi:MAG: hypothetical protein V9G08_12035 [Dermatophilaceae bacterium]